METQTPITNAVLLTTFPKLSRLDDFLQERLDHGLAFIQSDDSSDYKNLLHSTLVSTMEGHGHLKPFPTGNKPCPDGIQTEVVYPTLCLRRLMELSVFVPRYLTGVSTAFFEIGCATSN